MATQNEQDQAAEHLRKSASQSTAMVKGVRERLFTPAVQGQIERSIPTALAKVLTADRIACMALSLYKGSEALQRCSEISIIAAVIQAAQLGLVPDGLLGHAYLVPRKGQAVFQLGVRGAIALAYRTDRVRIRGRVVRACDRFEAVEGTDHKIIHARMYGADAEKSPIIAAYATAEFPDGGRDERVLDMWEIEKAKKVSASVRSGKQSPWDEWPEQMCEKTAIHRLCKQLPLSTEVAGAVTRDDAVAAGARVRHEQATTGEIETTVIEATSTEGEEASQ